MFTSTKSGKIAYTTTFKLEAINLKAISSISYTSFIDIENLILSCIGLLCKAARQLKYRIQKFDESLLQATQ
jgi:hypothetical protein